MKTKIGLVLLVILLLAGMLYINNDISTINTSEDFDIPLRSSSAWDWNLGPGYGAGYGTGYGLYGRWPATLPREPWKYWMWARRPLVFTKPFTPVPQIDYNDAPEHSKPDSNYNISILPQNGTLQVSVDGMTGRALQLDRLRNYYFHINTPGAPFMLTADGVNPFGFNPIETGSVQVNFDENDPPVLFYTLRDVPGSGGVIYLNPLKN